MKTSPFPLSLGLLVTVAAFSLSACAKRDAAADKAPATPDAPATSAGEAWDAAKESAKDLYSDIKTSTLGGIEKLDRATYNERMTVTASLQEAGTKLDADYTEWKRDGKIVSDANAQKIEAARAELRVRTENLATATAETWDEAKAKTSAAWTALQAAYAEARAEQTK